MKQRQQQGVALVVTLILLSVITFMAVTFLVLSRRGAEQVSTLTAQNIAKGMSDEAGNKATAMILSRMLAVGNGFDMPLFVSTNLISPHFVTGGTSITNVGYNYANGATIAPFNDQLRMYNNMLVLPRPPVFVTSSNGVQEFRFYLDLDRNGKYDTNGLVGERDENNLAVHNPTNFSQIVSNFHVGDPEWIGVLDHPDQRHSPSNLFIGRYAFICLPAGNALDINFIHNQAKQIGTNNIDGFLRNEGVGGWEINLAAFLHALNPLNNGNGTWNYRVYETNSFASSQGFAFDDANSLLQLRYNGSYINNLKSFRALYQGTAPGAVNAIQTDGIDWYCGGPLMTSPVLPGDNDVSLINRSWSGAYNTNQFFTGQDLFGGSALLGFFPARLQAAGMGNGTTNAYTFYRMLEQLATDGGRESGKLNLNYANRNGSTSTNFRAWGPLEFFTNAANAMLAADPDLAGRDITRIQLYPNNEYSPAVHRLLQLAANMYDATVYKGTNAAPNNFDYPSVFRPVFRVDNGTNIYINGYVEVGTNADYNSPPLSIPEDVATILSNPAGVTNIYGIPWIIGARKGFPNFNEISVQSITSLTRKLEVVKPTAGAARASWHTNVQYVLGITNAVGVEAWNSYSSNYTRPVQLIVADNLSMVLTNENGVLLTNITVLGTLPNTIVSNWPGFTSQFSSNSFILPVISNVTFLEGGVYQNGVLSKVAQFQTTTGYPQPLFGFNVTNRLRFILVDTVSGRVIDYVHMNGMDHHRHLIEELIGDDGGGPGGVWDTNRVGGSTSTAIPVWGINNQVDVSQKSELPYYEGNYLTPVTSNDWTAAQGLPPGVNTVALAATRFRDFMTTGNTNFGTRMQAPYSPTRTVSRLFSWQANDPLVHYTLSDLTGTGDLAPPDFGTNSIWDHGSTSNAIMPNLRRVNNRYLPWDGQGNPNAAAYEPKYLANIAIKDPTVRSSDDWQFPANKFPSIGWLGRVHRGTPWQTVYMKSGGFPDGFTNGNWQEWTGDQITYANNSTDAGYMRPTNDWGIFDLFTTAPNDNATRGQLSINQTNLAAWSALFSGVIVSDSLTNPVVIDPTFPGGNSNPNLDTNNAVNKLVSGINKTRNDFAGNVFTRLGDVLAVPELTMNSPFLDPTIINTDVLYERLPEQVMSLLKVGKPRYVIYAYGQALKPAPSSIFTGRVGVDPKYTGTCTNYQVVGEVVTRMVVRFESADPNDDFPSNNSYTQLNPTRNPVMPTIPGRDNKPDPHPRAVIESFTVLPPD